MSRRPGDLILHDPSAIEPQGFDWTAWLLELGVGVTISTSAWTVSTVEEDAAALTVSASGTILVGSLKTQTTLTAGTVGFRYTVTNHITTSTGVQDERSFKVLVEQR